MKQHHHHRVRQALLRLEGALTRSTQEKEIEQLAYQLGRRAGKGVEKADAWKLVVHGARRCGYASTVEAEQAAAKLFLSGWTAGVSYKPPEGGVSREHTCTYRCVPANCYQQQELQRKAAQ